MGVVFSVVVVAWMFNAAGIANLQAMIGAVGFTALTYYAPFAAYWKLISRPRKDPTWKQLFYLGGCAAGVLVMISGGITASVSITDDMSSRRFFDTSICTSEDILDLSACSNPCREAYGFANITCSN